MAELSKPRVWGRNAVIMAASTLTILAGTTIAPSLPGIVAHFGDDPNVKFLSQLILTVPALSIVFTAPFVGVLADRYGRRGVLLLALVVYGIAGAGGLYLDTISGLLLSRALMGVSVGAIMTATSTLVGDYYTGQARIRFMGYRSTIVSVGGIISLAGGGALAEFGWRAPFSLYLFGVFLLPFAVLLIDEPDASSRQAEEGAVSFGPWQEHARHAPLYLAGFVHFTAFYYIFTQVPFRMRDLGVTSTSMLGIALGTMTLFSAIFSMVYPVLRKRASTGTVFAFGFIPTALGFLSLSVANGLAAVIVSMAIVGVGSGFIIPNLTASAVSAASPPMRGRVAGIMSASVFLGQFLSPALTFPMVLAFGGTNTFRILAGLYVALAMLAVFFSVRTQRQAEGATEPSHE